MDVVAANVVDAVDVAISFYMCFPPVSPLSPKSRKKSREEIKVAKKKSREKKSREKKKSRKRVAKKKIKWNCWMALTGLRSKIHSKIQFMQLIKQWKMWKSHVVFLTFDPGMAS